MADAVKREPHPDDDDDNVPLALTNPKKKPKSSFDGADEPLSSLSRSKKKPVVKKEPKKEWESDDEEKPVCLATLKKKKKKIAANGDAHGNAKGTSGLQSTTGSDRDDPKSVEKPRKKIIKKEVTKKKKLANGKSGAERKVRKVYSLPGQKADAPEERDPLRIFYETLLQQMPTSEMAAIWMMERGLLPEKEAAMVYAKKQKNKLQQIKSPVKAVSAIKTVKKLSPAKRKEVSKQSPAESKLKTTKKRKSNDDSGDEDDDDDFIMPMKKQRN